MKIISWNINGYRAITGQNAAKRYNETLTDNRLYKFILEEDPDIICLQETKCSPDQIDEDKLTYPGYTSYWSACSARKGYSGVSIMTKKLPLSVNTLVGLERFDVEGRVLELDYEDFVLFNVYFPNGGQGPERVQYKLDFYDHFLEYTDKLHTSGKEIIICGDFNTAHTEIDLARPKENIETSGFMPIERERLDRMVSTNYTDSYRLFHKEPDKYTWWSQRGSARRNNVGWRIDYFFVTKGIIPHIIDVEQRDEVPGSDHCPVVLKLDFSR